MALLDSINQGLREGWDTGRLKQRTEPSEKKVDAILEVIRAKLIEKVEKNEIVTREEADRFTNEELKRLLK